MLTNREWELFDPMDTATEMSIGQQDSTFGDSADVEIWVKWLLEMVTKGVKKVEQSNCNDFFRYVGMRYHF